MYTRTCSSGTAQAPGNLLPQFSLSWKLFVNMMGDEDMDHEIKSDRPVSRDESRPLRLELRIDSNRRIAARPPRQDQHCQLLPVWQMSSERAIDANPKAGH
jgi:hypothetical protein